MCEFINRRGILFILIFSICRANHLSNTLNYFEFFWSDGELSQKFLHLFKLFDFVLHISILFF